MVSGYNKKRLQLRKTWNIIETSIGNGTLSENINISAKESISYCESKHHKPLFVEECSKLVD
jgi:hypothetical protein